MRRKYQPLQAPSASPHSEYSSKKTRRDFLARSAGIVGATVTGLAAKTVQATEPLSPHPPSKFEGKVLRTLTPAYPTVAPGSGSSRTPHHLLEGTITPSGLHFERHHNGVPEIDSAQHQLMIHGLVRKPLVFSMEALARYPMTSRVYFLECSGNSSPNSVSPKPPQSSAGAIHGMASCSEWTGVPLALLLNEAGLDTGADWILAEGADAVAMSRSVPLAKALDDAMVALYQNGERLRPEQGYPIRLLLPGWEGNMSVKWLRRIKLTQGPTHTKDETSRYTDPTPDGKALQFTFEMGVKSVITRPSVGMKMPGPGWYEISGLAWSGAGRIRRVEVTVDGGATWHEAALQAPVYSKSFTRFRLPWEWNGTQALLQSRAIDEKGNVQPSRTAWLAQYMPQQRYHNNAIQTWEIAATGSVANVYV
jgi:sulfane dehydrogenase subunit SoxC